MDGESSSPPRCVSVVLRTAAGDDVHDFDADLRLIDMCRLLRIPPGAVSFFVASSGVPRPVVGLLQPIGDLVGPEEGKLLLQFDRNLNYLALLSDAQLPAEGYAPRAVAEYLFASGSWGYVTNAQFAEDGCRAFVLEAVSDFIEQHNDIFRSGSRVVVGTSGGGDSNALLTALGKVAERRGIELIPVMLLGIPEWDRAVDRARRLCDALGLSLTVISSTEVNAALGRPQHASGWLADFSKVFPDEDPDVIGTLAIRLVLAGIARRAQAACVITGLNLEDLLAECLLRLMQGKQPLAFPVRELDGIRFCYPVYRVPKKILDGCHPEFSHENNNQRSIGVMMGRAVPYYLAQSMNALIPGVEFDLIEGFRALVHESPKASPVFGFATLDPAEISEDVRSRWADYINGCGVASS